MPPRSYPTARQRRLGAELRKLRERAGMSGSTAAAFLGGERAQISHIESGRYGVSAERVRRLAAHYSATDKHLVDALASMAEERTKGWWEAYRGVLSPGFLDLAELEHHATSLRQIEMLHIPGLLQIKEYARELMLGGIAALAPAEAGPRVEHRMARRGVFDRPVPMEYEALVHEAALRMRYCAGGVVREQLDFMHEVSQWPSVTLRIIPFEAQITGSVHSAMYVGATIPQLDTVQLDSAFGSGFLDAEAQLARYRLLFDSVRAAALDPDASRAVLRRIARER
ncbi:helix-turn-helix domain-containing protein [Streptomyces katsurahamanus]|uniref:Helix-turn-helix domain-containing protein n=1 Tax=Streptomyces katsurahamanus TaxID=2577098 RepID=A0ABW9P297_9ACTN|nr:helix-turn-helix transcriptional regulator [Streptomyces katsurahamanus]MQS39174.1 helix-turn-helix domain-containing protein [Streptomyces katsurahamanus]